MSKEKEIELLNKLKGLNELYKNSPQGRRQIHEEIIKTIHEIGKHTQVGHNKLYRMEMNYQNRNNFIINHKLLLDVILRIANSDKKVYGMKEITTTELIDFNEFEQKKIYGKCLIISNSHVLNKICNKEEYFHDEYSKITTKIIENGHSLIMTSPNYFSENVQPKGILAEVLKMDLPSGKQVDITCYLHKDALSKAVLKTVNYIDTNGCDFDGIDIDTLCELIEENNNEKKLVKIIDRR